jgi:FkbM family methyltransferase
MKFYSQQGEDIFIFLNFINQKRNDGIFLELGAHDGIQSSNTKFFEDFLNFTGILIEPSPTSFNKLIENRKKSKCYNFAINKNDEDLEFLENGPVSGIPSYIPNELFELWHKNSRKINVKSIPINKIINKENTKYIDFFSLDVEGAEDIVLDTMDWNIEIYVICIELHGYDVEKDEYCRNILKNKGFIFKTRIVVNEFWINENYSRKNVLYKQMKHKFRNLNDYGEHLFISPYSINEITKNLIEYQEKYKIT